MLENVLERAVINSSGPKLRLVDELKKPFKDLRPGSKTLQMVEREYIFQMLETDPVENKRKKQCR